MNKKRKFILALSILLLLGACRSRDKYFTEVPKEQEPLLHMNQFEQMRNDLGYTHISEITLKEGFMLTAANMPYADESNWRGCSFC